MSAALAKTPAGVAPVKVRAAVYKAAGAAGSHPVYPNTNIRAAGGKWASKKIKLVSRRIVNISRK